MFLNTSDWNIGGELPANFDVKARHAKYTDMLPSWGKCRDARQGAKAIKTGDNCEKYLPRLDSQMISDQSTDKTPKQKNEAYWKYKDRAIWYGGAGKTVEAFLGMVFSDTPKITASSKDIEDVLKDSDIIRYASQNDESFYAFMKSAADEILTVNRVGILEDFPVTLDENGEPKIMSLKEYEEKKIHSYSVLYRAEQITNWGMAVHNGKRVESYYILEERWLDYGDSLTKPEERNRWRILLLEEQPDKSLRYQQVA